MSASGEKSLDRRYFAPNGARLAVPNLNADSKHPNPWRPKTVFEAAMLCASGELNLLDNLQPILGKKEMDFETAGLTSNLAYYSNTGLKIGICHGAFDAINITKVKTFNEGLARTLYLTVPWVGMFTSYAAAYHLVNQFTHEKDKPRHYAMAAVAPGSVWGIFKRCPWAGSKVVFWLGSTMALVKLLNDEGFGFGRMTAPLFDRKLEFQDDLPANDPKNAYARATGPDPNWWKTADRPMWPVRGFDEGGVNDQKWKIAPDWHKYVSEEERRKGPPPGL